MCNELVPIQNRLAYHKPRGIECQYCRGIPEEVMEIWVSKLFGWAGVY